MASLSFPAPLSHSQKGSHILLLGERRTSPLPEVSHEFQLSFYFRKEMRGSLPCSSPPGGRKAQRMPVGTHRVGGGEAPGWGSPLDTDGAPYRSRRRAELAENPSPSLALVAVVQYVELRLIS